MSYTAEEVLQAGDTLNELGWDLSARPLAACPHMIARTSRENLERLVQHGDAVWELREFFKGVYRHPEDHEDYNWEETNFSDFTVGFLCAKGVPPFDAFMLDPLLRYTFQYFDMDPDVNPEATEPRRASTL